MASDTLKQTPSYKLGHKDGYLEALKACGNCNLCFGKGYATETIQQANVNRLRVLPCICPRGKALIKILDERVEREV